MGETRMCSTTALVAMVIATTVEKSSAVGGFLTSFQSPAMSMDYCNRTWDFPNTTTVLRSSLMYNNSAVSDYQMRYAPNVSFAAALPTALYTVVMALSLDPANVSESSPVFPSFILTDVNGSYLSSGFNVSSPPSGLSVAPYVAPLWNSSIPTYLTMSLFRQTNGTIRWSGGTPNVTMDDRFDFNSWLALHNVSSQMTLVAEAVTLKVFDSVRSFSMSGSPCPSELVQMALSLAAVEGVSFASTMTSPLFVSWTYPDGASFTQCNTTYQAPPAAYTVDPVDGSGALNTFSTLQTVIQPDAYFYGANASAYYTLVVIDDTYPTMQFLHLAVANVPGASVATGGLMSMGTVIQQWIPPFNQDGFDHTYAFYVYEQTQMIPSDTMVDPFAFNMTEFSIAYQLGAQVAGNFMAVLANPVFTRWFGAQNNYTLTTEVACQNDWAAELAQNATAQGIALPLVAAMGNYPAWTGAHPAGTVTVESAQGAAPLLIMYNMSGLPANSSGGMHIHAGTTCADASLVGGHYWQPTNMTDPWNVIMWSSDAFGQAIGNVTTTSGFGYSANLGHAVVLHASNGTRIGCGVLKSTLTQQVNAFFYQNGTMNFTACGKTMHLAESVTVLNSNTTLYGNAPDMNRLTVVNAVNTPVVTFAGEPGKMYTVLLVHEAPVEVAAAAMGATLHFAGANLNIYNASVAQGVPLNQLGGTMWEGNIAPYMPAYTYGAAPAQFVFYIYEQTGVVDVDMLTGLMNYSARSNFSRHMYMQNPAAMVGPLVGFQFANVFYDLYEPQLLQLLFPSFNVSAVAACPAQYLGELQTAGAYTGVSVPASVQIPLEVVWDTPPTTGTFACGQNMLFPRHVMGMDPTIPKGNDITTAFTRTQPTVYALQFNASANYTLIMADETVGFLHWLVVNIPGAMLNTGVKGLGDTLAPYFAPGNPNELPHQYVFRLAEQTTWVNPTNQSITDVMDRLLLSFYTPADGGAFDIAGFMATNGILPPYAQTWGSVWTSLFSVWALDDYVGGVFGTVPCPQTAASTVATNATSVGLFMPQVAGITQYPGFTGMGPMGNITVQSAQGAGPLALYYYLTGLPANSSGGFHIHTGTTCANASLVGGHYWQPANVTDPWNVVMWQSDSNGVGIGNVTVTSGFGYTENAGHAVVIHAFNGTRIGCGTLQSSLTMRADVAFYIPQTTNFSVCNTTLTTPQQQRTLNPIFTDPNDVGVRSDRLTTSQTVNEPIIGFSGIAGKYYSVFIVDQVSQFVGTEFNSGVSSFVHLAIANIPGESAATGVSGTFAEGDVLLPYIQPALAHNMPHGYVVYVLEQSTMVNVSAFNASVLQAFTAGYVRYALDVYDYVSPTGFGPMTFVGVNYVEIFPDFYSQYYIQYINSTAYGFTGNATCPSQTIAGASAQNTSGVSFGGISQAEFQLVSPLWVSYSTLAEVTTICNISTVLPRVMMPVDPESPKGDFLTVSQVRNPPVAFLYDLNPAMMYTVLLYSGDLQQLYWAVGDVLGADLMTGLNGAPSGTVLQSYLSPIATESYIELTFMVFEQPNGVLPPFLGYLFEAFDGPGIQLPALVRAANLGDMVAANFMKVYADLYALSFLNTELMGIYGTVECPALGIPYVQTHVVGASADVSGATAILSVAYRPQAYNMTTCGSTFSFTGGLQLADPVVPMAFAATRVTPNVSAYYTVGSGLNTSVLYSLVAVSSYLGDAQLTVNWFVKDINSSGIVTGIEGTTVLPYMIMPGQPGVVQYEFYLVPQLSTFLGNSTSRSLSGAITQFFGANGLGSPVAFNVFRANPDTYQLIQGSNYSETCNFFNITGQAYATCDASNHVMAVDGECRPNCDAMLLSRRACSACGTATVSFTLSAAPVDPVSAAAVIVTSLATQLSIATSAMNVGVDGSAVEVVLPAASATTLDALITAGTISPFVINGFTFVIASLITSAPTTAAPTTPMSTSAQGASVATGGVATAGTLPSGVTVPTNPTVPLGALTTAAPPQFNGPVLTVTFLGNLDSLSTTNQALFIQSVAAAIVGRSNGMISLNQFTTVLQAGSILAVSTFVDTVNMTAVDAVATSINAQPFDISLGGETYASQETTVAASGTTGASGSGGLSGGAKAAIVIVVLLTVCIVVYVVLVKMDKAPNVLKKMGGGAKKPKNPYEGAARSGAVPNAAYSGSVTLNHSYDFATQA